MAFIIATILIIIVVQAWSYRYALTGIDYTSESSNRLVEEDEVFEFITILTNHSSRFVPYLRIDEVFPENVQLEHKDVPLAGIYVKEQTYTTSAYLMPRSQLERRNNISIADRGCYVFRGAYLSGGDFLGLNEEAMFYATYNEVVVYPKAITSPKLLEMLGGFLGDVSVRRFIQEDPVLIAGIREYTGSEPFKQLSWKHTARLNQLMVKQFDYTLEPKITVLVDSSVKDKIGEYAEHIETCLSLASGVCHYLEQKMITYDFICNAFLRLGVKSDNYLPEGLGPKHFDTVLEWLGRSTYYPNETFSHTLERLLTKQEKNRSTILIIPQKNAEKSALIKRFAHVSGSSILTLYGEDFYAEEP